MWSYSSLWLYVHLSIFSDSFNNRQTGSSKVSILTRFVHGEFSCYDIYCILLDHTTPYDYLANDYLCNVWCRLELKIRNAILSVVSLSGFVVLMISNFILIRIVKKQRQMSAKLKGAKEFGTVFPVSSDKHSESPMTGSCASVSSAMEIPNAWYPKGETVSSNENLYQRSLTSAFVISCDRLRTFNAQQLKSHSSSLLCVERCQAENLVNIPTCQKNKNEVIEVLADTKEHPQQTLDASNKVKVSVQTSFNSSGGTDRPKLSNRSVPDNKMTTVSPVSSDKHSESPMTGSCASVSSAMEIPNAWYPKGETVSSNENLYQRSLTSAFVISCDRLRTFNAQQLKSHSSSLLCVERCQAENLVNIPTCQKNKNEVIEVLADTKEHPQQTLDASNKVKVSVQTSFNSSGGTDRPKLSNRSVPDNKMTTVCICIIVVFVICWLPLVGYRFSYVVGRTTKIVWYRRLTQCLAIANSLFNPFIYFLVRNDFRELLKRLLGIGKEKS